MTGWSPLYRRLYTLPHIGASHPLLPLTLPPRWAGALVASGDLPAFGGDHAFAVALARGAGEARRFVEEAEA